MAWNNTEHRGGERAAVQEQARNAGEATDNTASKKKKKRTRSIPALDERVGVQPRPAPRAGGGGGNAAGVHRVYEGIVRGFICV